LTWCCPRIHEILFHGTSMQRHLTSDWGRPASSSAEDTARELLHVCVQFYRSVSIFFVAEFNFTESFFDLCLYMNYISGIQRYYVWRVMTKYIVHYILQFCARNLFSCWQSCRDGSEREGVCVCVCECVCVCACVCVCFLQSVADSSVNLTSPNIT